MNPPNELPLEISCQVVKEKIEAGDSFLLVDCREPDEHAVARIDAACLVPMSELAGRLADLEPYRDREIVVHCHHGGRSQRVANWLRGQGFTGARTMVGGIDRWSEEIDPSVPRY